MVRILIGPQTHCYKAGFLHKNFVHRLLECRHSISRTHPSKGLPNERFMRFNEAKVSVVVFLVMTTPNPECEGIVNNVKSPAPVFRDWLRGLKSFGAKAIP